MTDQCKPCQLYGTSIERCVEADCSRVHDWITRKLLDERNPMKWTKDKPTEPG